MPTPEQVAANLPSIFVEKYPSTFAIIDASEVFIETPSDLHMQASTWSSYKHHNTAKFLVACSPNGTITYISPLHVGGISDVELTRASKNSQETLLLPYRLWQIGDLLKEVGATLNIPPFLSGCKQLSAEEVQATRKIASVRIHVERAIGRIKNFAILRGTLPLTMARLANQIVCVCAWLTAFQPALVPPSPGERDEQEVEDYFNSV